MIDIKLKLLFLYLFILICRTELSLQNVEADDYGDGEADKLLSDPNFDIEKMTERVGSNGQIRQTHLLPTNSTKSDQLGTVPQKKIVGGKSAKAGEVPYIVSLYEGGQQQCGGSIFNKDYVITAAHCFYEKGKAQSNDYIKKNWELIAGDHSISNTEANEQKKEFGEIYIHPKYNSKKNVYDIALVKVDKPFTYNHFVQPIPIGSPPIQAAGDAFISGWGYTKVKQVGSKDSSNSYYPDTLKTTTVQYISDADCRKVYANYRKAQSFINSGTLLCAGVKEGGKDACQADSGGPLACLDRDPNSKHPKDQKWLCGVVSTGFGCGLPGHPGFYTKIANPEIKTWINQIARWGDKPTRKY